MRMHSCSPQDRVTNVSIILRHHAPAQSTWSNFGKYSLTGNNILCCNEPCMKGHLVNHLPALIWDAVTRALVITSIPLVSSGIPLVSSDWERAGPLKFENAHS